MGAPSDRFFTLNRPELRRLQELAARQKPGLADYRVACVFYGWTTVELPSWKGGIARLYEAVRGKDGNEKTAGQ